MNSRVLVRHCHPPYQLEPNIQRANHNQCFFYILQENRVRINLKIWLFKVTLFNYVSAFGLFKCYKIRKSTSFLICDAIKILRNINVCCHSNFKKHEVISKQYYFLAWSIWRKPCSYPRCESLCPVDSGCFNHDIYPTYEFTVTCRDAYDTDVTDTFELFIDDNSPPYLTVYSKNSTGTLSLKQTSFESCRL